MPNLNYEYTRTEHLKIPHYDFDSMEQELFEYFMELMEGHVPIGGEVSDIPGDILKDIFKKLCEHIIETKPYWED